MEVHDLSLLALKLNRGIGLCCRHAWVDDSQKEEEGKDPEMERI
jgi:hypothetical protein